ncbi:Putative RNA polymerase ECF-subfamily sigma factor [Streptomyces hygroscopicus subsp. limoneus]|nr:Putative RNA polymerase ECF-subfamily sigma factor [Streptomyces hygroscopicus subsp. limoneus]
MAGTHPADPIADASESHRDRLRAVAYRMLGSHADAEDVVQEAWLRLSRQDTDTIDNLGGWLTTVVGRISLDVLRSGRTRPDVPLDARLPEFTVTLDAAPAPDDLVALGDSVGLALLTVLDSLRPDERLAFVLHDVFAVPHGEIGAILDKSADATKMLTSRARRKVRAARQPASGGRQQREVVRAFLTAARDGRFEQLLEILHPEVKFTVHTWTYRTRSDSLPAKVPHTRSGPRPNLHRPSTRPRNRRLRIGQTGRRGGRWGARAD